MQELRFRIYSKKKDILSKKAVTSKPNFGKSEEGKIRRWCLINQEIRMPIIIGDSETHLMLLHDTFKLQ